MSMEKIAFKMYLKPGAFDEYQRRHDAIWPELQALLRSQGIEDYSIYGDRESGVLFAVQRRPAAFKPAALAGDPVMRRWWTYMADIMRTHEDGSPVVEDLACLFHLD